GRFYAGLRHHGVPIDCVDVGGGLGVDYEGSHSLHPCSTNYAVQDYAATIVAGLAGICAAQNLPRPHILSESGRALTAHHAVLITNVIDMDLVPAPRQVEPPRRGAPPDLLRLWDLWQQLGEQADQTAVTAVWENTLAGYAAIQRGFGQGWLDLGQRAWAESVYHAISHKLQATLRACGDPRQDVLQSINEKRADKYFGNFSLFQSLPDVWAIAQFFPVMPLHRLDEEPVREAVIEDITCDSDGRIDDYVSEQGIARSLAVHEIRPGEEYLLGIFLVGAYQEILGDMHNLFGDTDSVHVQLRPDGGIELVQPLQGDTVEHVLRYVHFDPDELLAQYRERLGQSGLPAGQQAAYLAELAAGLHGYTYLEK
ncbi:MAG TPA: biosynthetic arginine decarboxylase, partial [Chromatiales bacterium]|nr:biosynthetic arginine decarboxylase [Chromatiales bacterium]